MLRPIGHINSYYANSCQLSGTHRPLQGRVKAHTVIIGGGLAGLTCARELARQYRAKGEQNTSNGVVLLEAQRFGWGASGRNGGFVSSGFAEGMDEINARVGKEQTRKLFDLSRMGANYVRDTIAELNRPDIVQGYGGVTLVRHGTGKELKQKAIRNGQLFGQELEFWDAVQLRQRINSPVYKAGLYDQSAFHIHPLAYVDALAYSAEEEGAQFYEHTRAIGLHKTASGWLVESDEGAVEAEHVVLATSAYGGFFTPLERALVPVATYVMASKPMGALLDGVINFNGTISDTRRAGDYYRIIGEGDERRLLWGGRITTRRSEPLQLARILKQDIVAIFPQLKDMQVDYAWSGLMGYPRHKMPLIGELWRNKFPRVWSCTGFGGHGLNTTAMAGCLIAHAIAENNEEWKAFQPFTPNWTGGSIGRIAAQLKYWQMQWQDRREESSTPNTKK